LTFRNKLSELPNWVLPILVAVSALTIRAVYFIDFQDNPFFDYVSPNMDNGNYDLGAILFSEGDWLININRGHSPFYMYVLGTIYALFGRDFKIVWIFQFTLGIGASVLVFYAGRLLGGKIRGLLAGLLFGLNGIVIFYEGVLLRENLALFFLILSFILFLKGLIDENIISNDLKSESSNGSKQNLYFVLGFIALSIAVQIRPNFGLLFPLIIGYLFWETFRRWNIRDRFLRLAGYSIIFFGLMIPIILRGYLVFNKWYFIDTSGGFTFLMGNLIQYPGTGFEPYPVFENWINKYGILVSLKQSLWIVWEGFCADSLAFVQMYLRKLYFIFSSYESASNLSYYVFTQFSEVLKNSISGFGLISALGIWGIMFSWRQRHKFSLVYIYLVGLTLGIWLFYPVSRFRYVLLPWLILIGSYALISFIAEAIARKKLKTFATGICLVLLIWTFTAPKWLKAEGRFVDYCNIAIAYFENERVFNLSRIERQAQICWDKEIERDIEHFKSRNLLSTAYNLAAGFSLKQGDKDSAKRYLKVSGEVSSFNTFSYQLLFQIYQNEEKDQEAISVAQMGLAINPNDSFLLEGLANLYIAKRQFVYSWPILVSLFKSAPNYQVREKTRNKLIAIETQMPQIADLDSLLKQANFLYDKKMWIEALAIFEKINSVNRSEPLLFVKEASIHGFLKNYEKAERAFLRALAIRPQDPDIIRMLADLYLFSSKQSQFLGYLYLSRFVQVGHKSFEYQDRLSVFQKLKYDFGNRKLEPLIKDGTKEENQKIYEFYEGQSGKLK
jgi:4-amino-4-deoxy-L-arabinose transferase-like glycosyltransferase/tetratricopeptide (TPR) repeat protein